MKDWRPVKFSSLRGWEDDDHQAAFACFRMSAKGFEEKRPVGREAVRPSDKLLAVAEAALALEPKTITANSAREFFEKNFLPMRHSEAKGFVTAYFEPVVEASRIKTAKFDYPLYSRPDDLVKIDKTKPPEGVPSGLEYARKTDSGHTAYFDRSQIDDGALAGRGLEIFWLESAIEAFYIHIQGSARLALTDGTSARVSFAGKTGHPYTSIGKVLVDRGVFTVEQANMKNMREWLEADETRALALLHQNRSYIFFSEVDGHDPDFGPIAAAGVQLMPGRSLAVDKSVHACGTPVWIATEQPLPNQAQPYRRLMIAQDTGSAIIGPQRGDLFIGSGDEAGMLAGSVRHKTEFIVLSAGNT